MQKSFNQNQVNFSAHGPQQPNANSLVSAVKKPQNQGKLSFANEFIKVKSEQQIARQEHFDPQQELFNKREKIASETKPQNSQTLSAALTDALGKEAQTELKKLRERETLKESQKIASSKEAVKDSYELGSKFNSSETTMAQAMQEHNKEVTEAYREGNLSEEQAAYQQSQERKRQLANWEELAPRIIEDPKNRAVRIDIPGLIDLETIIVRTKQGEVSIQTVGEKGTMEKLQSQEAILNKKLKEHNIKLASLQTFDAAAVAAAKAQGKEA